MAVTEEQMKYRNIIFDVGNVLFDYRWRDMLTDDYGLSVEEMERFAKQIVFDPLWPELDKADYTYQEVVELYVQKYPADEDVIRWFFGNTEMMPVARPRVWERVRQLKEAGFRIYLLSNYSEEMFRRHTTGAAFMNYLDGQVVSYEVHHIKPEPAIYHDLFSKFRLAPEECLFFDDRPENVEGSVACGMDAIRVTGEEQLLGELDRILRELQG
ncbi:MAG: HAD family phosphatase [Lachnospiraceae bacterium]|nr:HAD family phosphatase [Lachnospiraceae bacterium]